MPAADARVEVVRIGSQPRAESLTQKPTSSNHRLPLTAFETHNGRSTFAAGTALHAPEPTFTGGPRIGPVGPKNSDLSRRQTTMKSATDLPNGDPQHLREMTRFAQPKLSTVVGRIIDRLAHPRC